MGVRKNFLRDGIFSTSNRLERRCGELLRAEVSRKARGETSRDVASAVVARPRSRRVGAREVRAIAQSSTLSVDTPQSRSEVASAARVDLRACSQLADGEANIGERAGCTNEAMAIFEHSHDREPPPHDEDRVKRRDNAAEPLGNRR
jgi:hypothetical protein